MTSNSTGSSFSTNTNQTSLKRTHSIEIIEPAVNKRPANKTKNDIIIVDEGNRPFDNRNNVRDLFIKLKSMFPQKSDMVINTTLQKHVNDLDINKICNDLIEDQSGTKEDFAISSTPTAAEQQPSTSSNAMLEDDRSKISQIFPDCDPSYIETQLKCYSNHPNRVDLIIAGLFERQNYPRFKDKLVVTKKQQKLDSYMNMNMNFDDFLKLYPNPLEYFCGLNKNITGENYRDHCRIYLSNKYSRLSVITIDKLLSKNNFHFYPTIKAIQEALIFKNIFMDEAIKDDNTLQTSLDVNNNNNNRVLKKSNVLKLGEIEFFLWKFFFFQ
jgi:hypothetical protein